jgi:hypothetical protein
MRESRRKPHYCSLFSSAFVLASVCLGPASAFAEDSVDEQRINALFAEARAAFVANDFAEACPKFEEVVRLKPGLGARIGLGDCYRAQGRRAKAWEVYKGVVDDVPTLVKQAKGFTEQSKVKKRGEEAQSRIDEIEPKLGWIVLVVPDAVKNLEGLVLQVDGSSIDTAKFGIRMPVDRGEHVVDVSAKGKKTWDKTVALVEGAELSVAIQPLEDDVPPVKSGPTPPPGPNQPEVKPPPDPIVPVGGNKPPPDTIKPVPDTKSEFFSTQRIIGLSLGIVGAGAMIGGAVFGSQAIEKRDASEASGNCIGNRCNDAGISLRQESLAAANASTGLFIGGGVTLAAGVTLFLLAPKRKTPVQAQFVLGPSSLYCVGQF